MRIQGGRARLVALSKTGQSDSTSASKHHKRCPVLATDLLCKHPNWVTRAALINSYEALALDSHLSAISHECRAKAAAMNGAEPPKNQNYNTCIQTPCVICGVQYCVPAFDIMLS